MMIGMIVSAAAASAAASGLPITVPNMFAAGVDSAGQMLSGLSQLPEFVANTTVSDWSLTYEWGSAAHHGGAEMAHTATHSTTTHSAAEHAAHLAAQPATEPVLSDSAKSILGM